MSNENFSLNQSSFNTNDSSKILERIFNNDQSPKTIDAIFKHFEMAFKSQPNLVNTVVDFYFDFTSKFDEAAANITNSDLCQNNQKTILDLLLTVPDELSPKVFDRINEKLSNSGPSSSNSSSLNLTLVAQHAWLKTFEKALALLRIIAYNKKSWLPKLLIHSLFPTVIKLIKINSNLNDLITVETSLFFVALINVVPLQISNSHFDSVFQTFICLLKHYTYLEQNKIFNDGITWRSVKSSIRLFFYACYGLFPVQFIQNLRKKDHYLINKDFIRSTSFYLRFHPSLMREKSESCEKYLKQTAPNCDDYSLEWRQYCLDSMCTNYNQIINEIGSLVSTMNVSPPYGFRNQIATIKLADRNRTGLNKCIEVDSPLTTDTSSILSNSSLPNFSFPIPTSPSGYFSNSNQKFANPQELDRNVSKKSSGFANQGSMPTTPSLVVSNTGVFQYPVKSDQQFSINRNLVEKNSDSSITQLNNSSIKNLTLQFMVNDTETIGDRISSEKFSVFLANAEQLESQRLTRKHRSHSDSYLSSDNQILIKKELQSEEKYKDFDSKLQAYNQQTKSEMRDPNIKNPMSAEDFGHKILSNDTGISLSIPKTAHHFNLLATDSLPKSINQTENDDVLANFLTGLQQHQTLNETINNQEINKLNQDLKHLAKQLVYERHLRNKYEEDSNRLHFIKIQCDQLKEEKNYLEKNLKELVEQYKREVEECINHQKKVELNGFKSDLDERDLLIENIQEKLSFSESYIKELKEKLESIQNENLRLEKENGKLVQLLDRDQNLKSKNEIDQSYLKSLRYTTDLLRKKLLLMSKSQQELFQGFNNELLELTHIYNSQLLNQLFTKEPTISIDIPKNYICLDQVQISPNATISTVLLSPLYQFQQKTIDSLQKELDELKSAHKNLKVKFNQNRIELEGFRNEIAIKEKKIEELNETLNMEVIDMMAEMLKNHSRIQNSLVNVNKRLEEEVFKLRADLTEQIVGKKSLSEKIRYREKFGDLVFWDCEGNPIASIMKNIKS